jgi:hypothetical protein
MVGSRLAPCFQNIVYQAPIKYDFFFHKIWFLGLHFFLEKSSRVDSHSKKMRAHAENVLASCVYTQVFLLPNFPESNSTYVNSRDATLFQLIGCDFSFAGAFRLKTILQLSLCDFSSTDVFKLKLFSWCDFSSADVFKLKLFSWCDFSSADAFKLKLFSFSWCDFHSASAISAHLWRFQFNQCDFMPEKEPQSPQCERCFRSYPAYPFKESKQSLKLRYYRYTIILLLF